MLSISITLYANKIELWEMGRDSMMLLGFTLFLIIFLIGYIIAYMLVGFRYAVKEKMEVKETGEYKKSNTKEAGLKQEGES